VNSIETGVPFGARQSAAGSREEWMIPETVKTQGMTIDVASGPR
jgi:hypothetical protein